MGVALYAMFIAILVPGVKKAWVNGLVAVAGGLLAWGASRALPSLPSGWRIVIAILVASAVGAMIGGGDEAAGGAEAAGGRAADDRAADSQEGTA